MAGYQGNLPICYPHCVCDEQLKQERSKKVKIKIKKMCKSLEMEPQLTNQQTKHFCWCMHGA